MRKQQVFAKAAPPAGCDDIDRDASGTFGRAEHVVSDFQRHESRAGFGNTQTELTCDVVGETGRAHLWNRQAAGRDDEAFLNPVDIRLYVLLDPGAVDRDLLPSIAAEAARGGATLFQYRDKTGSA